MNIIAVDDEKYALMDLEQSIREATPDSSLSCFQDPKDALEFAQQAPVDVAFLDIEMGKMTGISLALQLKAVNPKTNIIFVTGHSDYMGSAFSIHVSGYVLKPAKPSHITREMENLRHPVPADASAQVHIRCFGNFDVFVDGEALSFPRAKSRELLAYLVHLNGTSATTAEITAVLWEDRPYNRSLQKQTQTVISQLMKTLKEAGIAYIIRKSWNSIAIEPSRLSCDYHEFLKGNVAALNAYTGEYMNEFAWAEMAAGMMTHAKIK